MQGMKVAIVDDDDALAMLLAEVLSRRGVEVEVFGSAEDLLAGDVRSFAAIVLDLRLPGMWGSECVYRLRQMGVCSQVIAMTGFGDEWDEDDLRDLGFDRVYYKPLDVKEFTEALLRDLGERDSA